MARTRDIVLGIIIGGSFLIFFLLMAVMLVVGRGDGGLSLSLGDRVAIVNIYGVIESSTDVVRQLKKWGEDGRVRAIVLHINSPGGGVAASQEIYEQVLRVKQETRKPIVASMGSICASGGYYIACASDQIVANQGSITGSIGVILQWPVMNQLLDKIGVQYETVKSGDRKDSGSPFRAATEEDRKAFQALIDDSYNQFVDAVAEQREVPREDVLRLADGTVYTGRQAKELGLVDMLGTFEEAVDLAGELSGLGPDPRRVREMPRRRTTLFDLLQEILRIDLSRLIGDRELVTYPRLQYIIN